MAFNVSAAALAQRALVPTGKTFGNKKKPKGTMMAGAQQAAMKPGAVRHTTPASGEGTSGGGLMATVSRKARLRRAY